MASGTVHSNLQLILFVVQLCILGILCHFRWFKSANNMTIAVFSMYGGAAFVAFLNFVFFSIKKTRNAIPPIVALILMVIVIVINVASIVIMYATDFCIIGGLEGSLANFGINATLPTRKVICTQFNENKNLVSYFTGVAIAITLFEGILLVFSPPSLAQTEKEDRLKKKREESDKEAKTKDDDERGDSPAKDRSPPSFGSRRRSRRDQEKSPRDKSARSAKSKPISGREGKSDRSKKDDDRSRKSRKSDRSRKTDRSRKSDRSRKGDKSENRSSKKN